MDELETPPRTLQLRFLAEPTDINFGGKVHGGMVMKWIDQAAYACATGWSGRYCVTVYVGGIRFYKPIFIGALVEVRATVIYTGTTSMHLAVDVWSRDPRRQESTKTTHCVIIFVALDDASKPVAVPEWYPQTPEDRRMEEYARKLMELRQGIEAEMQQYLGE
ncbi:MAG: acyl-CoA thioesterase [Litorilinea sp.]